MAIKKKMTAVQKKRVAKWVQFLREKVNPKKFSMMPSWICVLSERHGDTQTELRKALRHECGIAACAAGWLPVIFPRSWGFDDAGFSFMHPRLDKNVETNNTVSDDICDFFGFRIFDADTIVYPMVGYNTPKTRAKLIERIAKEYK